MSLSNLVTGRRSVLAILALSACGFTPAFGTKGPAEGLLGTVRTADPTDKNSFDFVQRMDERLGRPTAPAFDLAYTIKTLPVGVGITTSGAITRYNLTGSVVWSLTRRADHVRLTGGTVQSFTSYSATGSTVAGLAAEEDAGLRLMRLLADEIVMRMVASSATWAK
ncbi:MAG: LPS assembly lipoprotein LptE [Paracoccaceae bacterium]